MCAGVPSELGSEAILKKMGIRRDDLVSIRYRGDGWPGVTKAITNKGQECSMTYKESWGSILNKYLQPRCKVCVDGSGESADITCADAWEQTEEGYPSFDEKDGRSLILIRTHSGLKLINDAIASNLICIEDIQIEQLSFIQPYQVKRKQTALARTIALRFVGAGVPSFRGYSLLQAAVQGGLRANFNAFAGTLSRKIRGRI